MDNVCHKSILWHNFMAYGDNFKVFGPYARKDNGRKIVIIIDDNGVRRTVSYPKWLMELQLGRPLDKNLETIDHYNSDINDNSYENLRIVPRAEHSADDTRRVKLVKFTCPMCKKEFERSPRLIRDKAKKNCAGPFCSRSCGSQYSRKVHLKLIEKLDPQPYIDSEYYKRKYIKAFTSIIDYDILVDYICDIWD